MHAKADDTRHEVIFHTYPKLIFAWPIIVVGLFFTLLTTIFDDPSFAALLGWPYLIVVAVVVLTIGVDVERNHAMFWLVVFIALVLFGVFLQDRGIPVLSATAEWIAGLGVTFDRGFGLLLSLLLLPPYLVMLIWARLQHRWRITHNEFEHYSWGRADDSLARGAKRVRSTYPDLLEFLLCGSGTLIVYSATGRSELRRIPHVPMIFLVRKRINRLLESTAITTRSHDSVELAEAEDQDAEEEEMGGVRDAALTQQQDDPAEGIGGKDPL